MSARDELATDLALVAGIRADAILAARYAKSHTITTAEELDALPNGSVIITAQGEALLANKEYRLGMRVRHWHYGGAGVLRSESVYLPATVLYEPTP